MKYNIFIFYHRPPQLIKNIKGNEINKNKFLMKVSIKINKILNGHLRRRHYFHCGQH